MFHRGPAWSAGAIERMRRWCCGCFRTHQGRSARCTSVPAPGRRGVAAAAAASGKRYVYTGHASAVGLLPWPASPSGTLRRDIGVRVRCCVVSLVVCVRLGLIVCVGVCVMCYVLGVHVPCCCADRPPTLYPASAPSTLSPSRSAVLHGVCACVCLCVCVCLWALLFVCVLKRVAVHH